MPNEPRFPPFDSEPHQTGGPVLLSYNAASPDAIGGVPQPPAGVRTVSVDTTVLATDAYLFVSTLGDDVIITLPDADRAYPISIHWKTPSSHSLTVKAQSGDSILNLSTYAFPTSAPGRVFKSDGGSYWAVF